MTQAIVNNTNIMQNVGMLTEQSSSGVENSVQNIADKSDDKDFEVVYDTALTNNNGSSLGDVKEKVDDGDITALLSDFTNFLLQVSKEANMEKSLDLTLAKDVAETVTNIKTFDTLFADESSVDSEAVEGKQVLFGQILSSVSNEDNFVEVKSDSETVQDLVEPKIKETLAEETGNTEDLEMMLDEEMLTELNIESVEGDSANNEGLANQQQTPEEFGVKVMLNQSVEKSDITFEKAVAVESTKSFKSDITTEKIIEQITKHFDSLKSTSGVKIVLNPESLGKVDLQIINTKEGLSAQFTVTTNEAREILARGLDGLKESLLSQGIGVDNILVKVQETEESSYNPDWTEQENSEDHGRQQSKQQREEKEKGLFEKTIAERMTKENGNV